MARVYIDTSVVIALANSEDEFHASSITFMVGLRGLGTPSLIGPPFLLKMAKATELRGSRSALQMVEIIEEYGVELVREIDDQL